MSTLPSAIAPGTMILARYRVMGTRGEGGFGTVLICWDTRLQRRVAIKRIPVAATGAAASTVAAALSEARTASLLTHSGIVTVYNFESDADYAYLLMECVDGLTLDELLRRVEGGALTCGECAYIISSVADALTYAHVNGVLHLDIKPTNIMISAAGAVKLCDFGMASLASAAGYGGARGGTVGYMPPEQVVGALVDERADVFSLAVVAWQALTGTNPFAAPTAEASLALMRRGPRGRLSKLVPGITPATDDVMSAALAPDPPARTASVLAFSSALVASLGDTAAGARSIAALLDQATNDDPAENLRDADLPVSFRYPWLPGVVTRAAAALSTAASMAAPAAALWDWPALGVLLSAALSAAWPPLGSALSVLTLAAVLAYPPEPLRSSLLSGAAAGPSSALVMLPGLMVVAFALWWSLVARRARPATTALLAPVALGGPGACAAIAGAYLPPARAGLTAAAAWIFYHLHAHAVAAGFNATVVVAGLPGLLGSLGLWVSLAGACVAAVLIAAITRATTSVTGARVAQAVGSAVVVASQLMASAMENDGIVAPPTWSGVGVALVLGIGMGIVVALGGVAASKEGTHELHQDL